ncbi:ATP-dependent RecD-like DNA helicase [Clostridium neuense]|uniref:ATP-dependent RecD-like DNA helicase n=1 Tax=Clostridium neuense TaxID=1728934 RepID=A0ABW8TG44_9CLOT
MEKKLNDKRLEIKIKLIYEFNLDKEIADELIRDYGMKVANVIISKPYILGRYLISMNLIKEIIENNSIDKNEDYKNMIIIAAAILYTVEDVVRSEGHVFIYKSDLKSKFKELNEEVDEQKLEMTLNFLEANSEIVRETDNGGRECVYLTRLYKAEVQLADIILGLMKKCRCKNSSIDNDKIEKFISMCNSSDINLNNNQIKAVHTALNSRISIVSGMAGTGKSTIIKTIIAGFKYMLNLSEKEISIVSYTGKSVNEMTKKTGIKGKTVHRFLGIGLNNKYHSIKTDVLIIDECGLIGLELMTQLLYNTVKENPNVRIVIMGDPFQLKSIEAGCVLEELLKSKVIKVTELKDIVRQKKDSLIINNACKIINGIQINGRKSGIWFDENEFQFLEVGRSNIKTKVIEVVNKLLSKGISICDIQIISPTKKGINGIEELNKEIANSVNGISGRYIYKFGILDMVMVTENDYSKEVFNGQKGIIKRVEINTNRIENVTVDFNGKEALFVNDEISCIELAYVSTVHKMQGSESKVVIIVVDEEQEMMLTRELLYVAVTRGIERVVIVGNKKAFNEGVRRVTMERHSLLAERIIEMSNIN